MSSPLAASTPMPPTQEASKHPVARSTTAVIVDPSTPAVQATPSSNGFTSAFATPSAIRVAGKTIGKTIAAQKGLQAPPAGSTPNFGSTSATFDSPSIFAMEPRGSSMRISMSGLGFNASALGGSSMGRVDDTERRRRLESVLSTLGQSPGRVSQEGIQRLARKLGMEIYSETTATNELMTLAGNAYAVDLLFQPNNSSMVDKVELHFHGPNDSVTQRAPDAARILHKQLQPTPHKSSINVMLDQFAQNLEKLQRLDKLSTPDANCFDAIAGVHASLERLYQHELKIARGLHDQDWAAGMEVMCKRSGKPQMHVGDQVGLSLKYWTPKHRYQNSTAAASLADGDAAPSATKKSDDTDRLKGIYSMTIECDYSSPTLYPFMRVSSDWISPQITAQPLESNYISQIDKLDWQDPPLLPVADPLSTTNNDQATQPQARFIANLEPPIRLPVSAAQRIFDSVGVNLPTDATHIQNQTPLPEEQYDHSRTRHKIAHTFDSSDQPQDYTWETRLYVMHTDSRCEITSIPFSHPRQLLPILTVLRQYAMLKSLLGSIATSTVGTKYTNMTSGSDGDSREPPPDPRSELNALLDESFSAHDMNTSPSSDQPKRILDVTLVQTYPNPQLSIVIPSETGPRTFGIEVYVNGDITVKEDLRPIEADDIMQESDGPGQKATRRAKALADGLALCEDLVLWAEWLRQH